MDLEGLPQAKRSALGRKAWRSQCLAPSGLKEGRVSGRTLDQSQKETQRLDRLARLFCHRRD